MPSGRVAAAATSPRLEEQTTVDPPETTPTILLTSRFGQEGDQRQHSEPFIGDLLDSDEGLPLTAARTSRRSVVTFVGSTVTSALPTAFARVSPSKRSLDGHRQGGHTVAGPDAAGPLCEFRGQPCEQ